MNIQGIGNRTEQAFHPAKQTEVRGKSGMAPGLQETLLNKVKAGDAEPPEQNEGQGTGVVGLLQEGHFKGVADVRLRINFFAELQSATAGEVGDALDTGIQGLETGLDTRVQDLGEEFLFTGQVEDLMNTFEDEMNGLMSGLPEGQIDTSAILAGVRDAFTDLFSALQQFAPVSADEPADGSAEVAAPEVAGVVAEGTLGVEETAPAVDDGVPAADDTAVVTEEAGGVAVVADIAAPLADDVELNAEPTEFSLALQSLQEWFEAEIGSLETTLSDLRSLPPLSEPRGNGVAYSRFLEMYNEMTGETGGGNDETAASPSPGIETAA